MLGRLLLRTRPSSSFRHSPFVRPTLPRLQRAQMSSSQPPKLEHIDIETEDGIAILKYDRPKNGNALHTPLLKDLLSAINWAEQSASTRVIITTGKGKLYTAGLDLLDPINQGPSSTISSDFITTLGKIHESLINTNKIVISAVNGPAPGWGTSSLALSDLVYSVPDAFFFTPFVQWGLCAEGCSSLTFKSIMGRQKASALILAGQRMTAQELESAGLITKVLSKENFMEDVMKIARGIIKLPPKSLATNKELMMKGTREALLETNTRELELLSKQAAGDESKDAIKGFAEAQARKKQEKAKL